MTNEKSKSDKPIEVEYQLEPSTENTAKKLEIEQFRKQVAKTAKSLSKKNFIHET